MHLSYPTLNFGSNGELFSNIIRSITCNRIYIIYNKSYNSKIKFFLTFLSIDIEIGKAKPNNICYLLNCFVKLLMKISFGLALKLVFISCSFANFKIIVITLY